MQAKIQPKKKVLKLVKKRAVTMPRRRVPLRNPAAMAAGYGMRADPGDPGTQAMWGSRQTGSITRTTGALTRVTKTEVFDSVTSDVNGDYTAYWTLNPANEVLVPWLSMMAPLFEQFKFASVTVTYVPVCNYVATGQVCAAFLYDALDTPSLNVQSLSAYEGAVLGAVRTPLPCRFDAARAQFPKYQVLSNGVYTVDRASVPALFGIVLAGAPPNTLVGRLQISYTVDFFQSHSPERFIASRFARISRDLLASTADPTYITNGALTIPVTSQAGWMTYEPTAGNMTFRPDIASIDAYVFIYDLVSIPTGGCWNSTAFATNNACVLSLESNGPLPIVDFYQAGTTTHVSGRMGIFAHMICRKPAGVTVAWGFRWRINFVAAATGIAVGEIMDNVTMTFTEGQWI